MATIGTDIAHAAGLLRAGKLVAVPTETVYGLAANALDAKAVMAVFEAKGRPHFDPLIVHVADRQAVDALITGSNPTAERLMARFWPGPLTIVLPKSSRVPDLVTSGLPGVALRMPAHPMVRQLLGMLEFPLAAPSANPFGYVSPTSAEHVRDSLGSKVGYVLDGGTATIGIESTIIGFEEGEAVVYRLGGLGLDEMEAEIGPVRVSINHSSDPKAPGMLRSHYAPAVPIRLGSPAQLLVECKGKDVGFLGFCDPMPGIPMERQLILSQKADLHEAAHNLFAMLRGCERLGVDLVIAEEAPDTGLGRAINDRLRRAAAT